MWLPTFYTMLGAGGTNNNNKRYGSHPSPKGAYTLKRIQAHKLLRMEGEVLSYSYDESGHGGTEEGVTSS